MTPAYSRTRTASCGVVELRRLRARIKRQSEAAMWLARLILPDVYKTN